MKLSGRTRVVEKLGEGGMGQVYRARDTRLDRPVAIKILPPALAGDPIFRERFEREARTLSGLSHPNICTVHDVGRMSGTDYLVMEYLEGTDARRSSSSGAPCLQAMRCASPRKIADALIVAHRHGIVHRDLKPANVMIVRGTGGGRDREAAGFRGRQARGGFSERGHRRARYRGCDTRAAAHRSRYHSRHL